MPDKVNYAAQQEERRKDLELDEQAQKLGLSGLYRKIHALEVRVENLTNTLLYYMIPLKLKKDFILSLEPEKHKTED